MPEMTTTREWIEQVLEEHRQLDEMVAELRSFLEAPRPEPGQEGAHRWSTDLIQRLTALHDALYRHFREEEDGGMMEDLTERHPRAVGCVDELVADHATMLQKLRRITATAMEYSEGRELPDPCLRRRITGLLGLLKEHEEAETDLIQRMEYEELGLGD